MSRLRLTTADGVPIDAFHDDSGTRDLALVIAHGFTGSWQRPAVRRAAGVFAEFGGVISFDFRGHGTSGGLSTVGDREVHDLAAAVAWARQLGYARVATVGFSMGASVAVRHGGLARDVQAIVAVSGPARWYYRGTPQMRRLHWAVERPLGRLVSRIALCTKIDPVGWVEPLPEAPYELVVRISPVPLLIVHGDADRYFPLEHAHQLFEAAQEPKELWVEPGFGHAENAATPELLHRIGEWVVKHVRT